jgi:hypothetical protein
MVKLIDSAYERECTLSEATLSRMAAAAPGSPEWQLAYIEHGKHTYAADQSFALSLRARRQRETEIA